MRKCNGSANECADNAQSFISIRPLPILGMMTPINQIIHKKISENQRKHTQGDHLLIREFVPFDYVQVTPGKGTCEIIFTRKI